MCGCLCDELRFSRSTRPGHDLGCVNVDITTLHACSIPSISAREQVDPLNGDLCFACLETFTNILLMTANR